MVRSSKKLDEVGEPDITMKCDELEDMSAYIIESLSKSLDVSVFDLAPHELMDLNGIDNLFTNHFGDDVNCSICLDLTEPCNRKVVARNTGWIEVYRTNE